ncbi:hypothetical protein BAW75_04660 [Micromonospora chalcea]|nr:hypothetical protein BAW75_04170 [Micromonospora chalcea]PPA57665.1 hypothetical protein BAW75_04660 [Micromonospora chalcea]
MIVSTDLVHDSCPAPTSADGVALGSVPRDAVGVGGLAPPWLEPLEDVQAAGAAIRKMLSAHHTMRLVLLTRVTS